MKKSYIYTRTRHRNNLKRDFCSQFNLGFVTFRLSISELQNRQIKLHRVSMPSQGRAVLCHVEPIVAGKCVETRCSSAAGVKLR